MNKKIANWSENHLLLKLSNLHCCRAVQFNTQTPIDGNEFRLNLWEISDGPNRLNISYNGNWIGNIDKRTGEIEARFESLAYAKRIDFIASKINKWDSIECEHYREAIKQIYANQLQRAQQEYDRVDFRLSDQSRLCL